MRLKNKQTGKIGLVHCDATMFSNKIGVFIDNNHIDLRNPYKVYDSLAELNAEWEDAPEEPKEYWYVSEQATVVKMVNNPDDIPNFVERCSSIGNLFKTKEEAEKAVDKLKAITRLSKCGFRFEGYNNRDRMNGGDIVIYAHVDTPYNNLIEDAQPAMLKDLDLLFSGGE